MCKQPTYEKLEQRVKELERKVVDHKRVEESLQLSGERYKEIFKNIKNRVAVYKAVNGGQDFIFADFNEAAEKTEIIKKDALIGKSVAKVFPDVKDFGLFEVFQRVCKTGKPEHHQIAAYEDERIKGWKDYFVYKLPSEEIVVVYSDETKRKQAEDALRESEERFRDTATMLPSVIIEYDLNGILTYVNPHGYELAGYELEDFEEGFHVLRLVAPEERAKHYERITRMMQGEKIPPTEYRLLGKDGSIFWGLVTSSLIHKDDKVVGVRTYTIDITDRKEAEEALKERTRELELQKKTLEELNTAMKVLLIKRDEDKIEVEQNVMANVRELISPYFDKINNTELDDYQKTFLNILESNLNEIVSPFTRKLSLKYLSLTPKEIQIVNMIKIGYPSKKIAKIMKISPRTVDTHRKNIRGKIGLGKKRANLRSHLLAHEQ